MLYILLLLLALSSNSLGDENITLSTVAQFTDFIKNVNSGNNYSKTTVYLGSDITLSESVAPIGKNEAYHFCGVFDGQGHIINNLTMNSSSYYTGLFGYSTGLTIKNIVLDSSCSIKSMFTSSDYVRAGGIIGYCWAASGRCNIENAVNMADVSFSGSTNRNNLYIGGIVGYLSSPYSSYSACVKNCVNYGSVTDSGTVNSIVNWAELGGIVGYSSGSSYHRIQNCLNYGTITHNGKSANLMIGGIVGYGYYTYIENCVNAGKISTQTKVTTSNCIGSIIGKVYSGVHINHCYYTSDVNVSSINGTGTPNSTTGTPNSPTSVDSDLVSKLSSNATSCNWNNWFMLHLNGGSINNLAQDTLIGIQWYIPNPEKEGSSFMFWCKDGECTEEFDPTAEPISGITDLYAAWLINVVTFDFGNGTTVNETFTYNTEIVYPENSSVVKEGYTFSQWVNYHELMPTRDITVTVQWIANNYTVIFDVNDGSASETSKIVTFNEKYGELPESNKTGYLFLGWFTSETNGTEVTNETIVTVPYNHTLYARWEEVTNQVEIVFSTKDLTEEEVKKLIEQYTKADFTISEFGKESGETRIVIKFVGKDEAEGFVRKIKESDEATTMIKRIAFNQSNDDSFSATIYPLSFLDALFFMKNFKVL